MIEKRFLRRLAVILLALSLMLAGACTGTTGQSDSGSSAASSGSSSVPASGDEGGDPDGDGGIEINLDSQYPIVNEKVSMTLAVTVNGSEDPEEMWFFEHYEQKTNVHWDFIVIQADAWTERKPIMMATGDYPDVFFGQSFTSSEIMKLGAEGTFIPLNDLIQTYGDMIIDKLNMRPESWAAATCPDGNIYALPSVTLSVQSSFPFVRNWINETWLENVGLDRPTTIDEYYEVLKAFKEQDADGDGDSGNEIPLSGVWASDQPRGTLLNAFGFASSGEKLTNLALLDGEAVFMPLTERYREYLEFAKKLYDEGLLDIDVFTQDDTQFKAKSSQGIVGSTQYSAPVNFDQENYENYTAFVLSYDAAADPIAFQSQLYAIGKFEITDKCQYPEVAMRWANMFYTPEVVYNTVYGPEYGTEDDPDGIGSVTVLTDEGNFSAFEYPGWDPDEMTLWEFYASNKPINSIFGFGHDSSYALDVLKPGRQSTYEETLEWHAMMMETENPASRDQIYWRYPCLLYAVPHAVQGYPIVYLADEQQDRVNEIQTPLGDFVETSEAKFITGASSIETEYDAFIEQIIKLGAEEYQKIYVDAYSDYLANQ